ncbi:hypothetical protein N7499_004070 [Penicillium canescens]|nr:hypothetical protein N7499_004070 [Penicillium canescens]
MTQLLMYAQKCHLLPVSLNFIFAKPLSSFHPPTSIDVLQVHFRIPKPCRPYFLETKSWLPGQVPSQASTRGTFQPLVYEMAGGTRRKTRSSVY